MRESEDIARYLELFASQVAVSARDSEEPIATLGHSILAIARSAEEILQATRNAQPGGLPEAARALIERQCVLMLERVRLAVVAFQFQDLLSQRLHHVREGLTELARNFRDPQQQADPQSWQALGERVRGRYSLHEQCTLFDAVVNGITSPATPTGDAPANDDSARVELF